jgi:hypothetical protein
MKCTETDKLQAGLPHKAAMRSSASAGQTTQKRGHRAELQCSTWLNECSRCSYRTQINGSSLAHWAATMQFWQHLRSLRDNKRGCGAIFRPMATHARSRFSKATSSIDSGSWPVQERCEAPAGGILHGISVSFGAKSEMGICTVCKGDNVLASGHVAYI